MGSSAPAWPSKGRNRSVLARRSARSCCICSALPAPRHEALELLLGQAEAGFGCYHSRGQAAFEAPTDICLLSTTVFVHGVDSLLFDIREFAALPPGHCRVFGEQMSRPLSHCASLNHPNTVLLLNSFSRQWAGDAAREPLVEDELVEQPELSHGRHQRQEPPGDVPPQIVSHMYGTHLLGVHLCGSCKSSAFGKSHVSLWDIDVLCILCCCYRADPFVVVVVVENVVR